MNGAVGRLDLKHIKTTLGHGCVARQTPAMVPEIYNLLVEAHNLLEQ